MDDRALEPLQRPRGGQLIHHGRIAPGVDRSAHQRHRGGLQGIILGGHGRHCRQHRHRRSEEHTSELQSLMRISYAVFCLKKKTKINSNKKYNKTKIVTQEYNHAKSLVMINKITPHIIYTS